MNKLIEKPHLIFLFTIPIIILIGILNKDELIDINVHDTYFIVSYLDLSIIISILFGIIGFGYFFMQKTNRKLSKWLNLIHIGLTFGGIIIASILTQLYRDEIIEYEYNDNLTLIIMPITILTILGQFIFPINIVYGLVKKLK